jgi:uncharacterized MAPEG superfamily protein
MMEQQTLTYFVAASAYLYLKMFANTGVQAYARFRYKSFKYKEDSPFFREELDPEKPEPEILVRASAAWRNDLENIPIFLVAALCGLLTGVNPSLYGWLLVAFCAGRTVQTVTLILGKQPWRFLGYVAGQIATGTMFVMSLRQLGW